MSLKRWLFILLGIVGPTILLFNMTLGVLLTVIHGNRAFTMYFVSRAEGIADLVILIAFEAAGVIAMALHYKSTTGEGVRHHSAKDYHIRGFH